MAAGKPRKAGGSKPGTDLEQWSMVESALRGSAKGQAQRHLPAPHIRSGAGAAVF